MQIHLVIFFIVIPLQTGHSVSEVSKTLSTKRDCKFDHYWISLISHRVEQGFQRGSFFKTTRFCPNWNLHVASKVFNFSRRVQSKFAVK